MQNGMMGGGGGGGMLGGLMGGGGGGSMQVQTHQDNPWHVAAYLSTPDRHENLTADQTCFNMRVC